MAKHQSAVDQFQRVFKAATNSILSMDYLETVMSSDHLDQFERYIVQQRMHAKGLTIFFCTYIQSGAEKPPTLYIPKNLQRNFYFIRIRLCD